MEEEFTFDPMTGEKIVKKTEEAPEVKEEVSYDPMTGEKIVKTAPVEESVVEEKVVEEAVEESLEEEPYVVAGEPKKSSKKMIGIIIGASVAVLAVFIMAIVAITSGVFMSPANKILAATGKTFAGNEDFMELNEVAEILMKDSYTLTAEISGDEMDAEVSFIEYGGDKGVKFDAESYGEKVQANVLLTNKELQVYIPEGPKKTFIYNYKDEKNGFLMDEFEEEEIETIDNMLAFLYENDTEEEALKLQKDTLKAFRDLKFKKAGKESFKINGRDRKCTGYTTEFGPDQVEIFAEIYREYYESIFASFGDSELTDEMMEEFDYAFDDMMDELEYMDDYDMTFYLYKGRLAAVVLDGDVEVQFVINNTKNPLLGMTLVADDGYEEIEVTWEGEVNGKKEEYELRAEGQKMLTIEYDKAAGKANIEIPDAMEVEVEVKKASGAVSYAIDGDVDGEEIGFELTVSGKTEKLEMADDKFDIGNASEEDFEDLSDELEDMFY